MSLMFGDDVLSTFPASRAVEDDDDDGSENVVESPGSVIRWSSQVKNSELGPLQCESLIIAIGPAATGFIQVYVLDSQPSDVIGLISSGFSDSDVNTFSQTAPSDKTCYIHRLTNQPDVILVQCNSNVTPEQSFSWSQQLCGALSLDAAEVVVLTTSSLAEFKSVLPAGDLLRNFLRTLCTRRAALSHSAAGATPTCATLEQPNTVAGLPAQILTHCEVHQIPAVLYICYTDTAHIEVETINAFRRLLPLSPFKTIAQDGANVTDRLARLVRIHANHSTLYI